MTGLQIFNLTLAILTLLLAIFGTLYVTGKIKSAKYVFPEPTKAAVPNTILLWLISAILFTLLFIKQP